MAGADISKLQFKVRLCIEGIPPHVRQVPAFQQLLPQHALLEGIDRRHRNDNDANYYYIILWTKNPNDIAKEGTLRLEEPHDHPPMPWHFADPVLQVNATLILAWCAYSPTTSCSTSTTSPTSGHRWSARRSGLNATHSAGAWASATIMVLLIGWCKTTSAPERGTVLCQAAVG
jgi:hypothetical protein